MALGEAKGVDLAEEEDHFLQIIDRVYGRFGHIAWHCFNRFNQDIPLPSQNQASQPRNSFYNPNTLTSSNSSQGSSSASIIPPPLASSFHHPTAFLAASTSVSDHAWYPDTGASHHVNPNQSNLMTCSEYTRPEQVQVGNGAESSLTRYT
ncbi:uncharacterized protein LOC110264743 [Arachis ipaensis]|uniref:uncharacterized protein LOC110264743 n=1 Tax=Arachis ipaensis TaxID=130454 RepID=UPI000A2B46B5|nr:uncharacterized protein LOC110264743 [Arachis ipaensis]